MNALPTRPDAISRLRRFVLDLAVRGRLATQDPNDEPASELLKRIDAEKSRLLKAGEIRADNSSKLAASKELPFDLAHGWHFTTIEEVLTELQTGPFGSSLHQSDYQVGGTPVINPASIQNERIVPIEKMAVGPSTLERLSTFKLRAGDIVVGRRGEMGRCAVVSDRERGWLCGTGSLILRPSRLVYPQFLVLLIGSPFGREYLGGTAVGTTMQNLNQGILLGLAFGLPPLAEQQRIVAKVDELMALCDRLEAARAERESTRDRLTAASLARLNGCDPEAFQDDAGFALDTLPALTARADQIKQLRQTILDLAAMGRLTISWRMENPSHGEAAQIIRGLEEAHEQNGGHRRGNAAFATEGAHDFNPRDLPSGWGLTELRSAVRPDRPITYGILMPGPDTPGGVPYVRVTDFPTDKLNLKTIKRTTKEIEQKYERARLAPNDVLLSIRGTIGRTCLVPLELDGANITQDTARLSLQGTLDRDFVLIVLRAPATQLRMQKCSKGVAVRGINIGDVRAIQLPVPPLAEQRCIVAKVNELLALCDRLEASLITADKERRRLLEALLAEALADDEPKREAAE